MSRILVTGAAGFIGSHLCEALVHAAHDVIGVDSFDEFYNPAVKRRNIERLCSNDRFDLVEADIRDQATMGEAVGKGVDLVVHLAARAGVRPSIEQPLLYQDVNLGGTMVLLEACRQHGVQRFIFAGSSSVYGNNKKVPFAESDPVDHPISPYAATKKAGELLCHTYHHLFGMSITSLRFFTVYGPRQRPDLAIHKFARLIEEDKPIPVFGDGTMTRDHTYIDDIIDGALRAIDRCDGFHIYNLGESRPVSLTNLIGLLEDAMGKSATLEPHPLQPGDVSHTYADVTLAINELGYKPATDMKTGLAKFVEWFRSADARH